LFLLDQGGLRSGPARNADFQPAFELLQRAARAAQDGKGGAAARLRARAVGELARARRSWVFESADGAGTRLQTAKPGSLVRAARHYEGAPAHSLARSLARSRLVLPRFLFY
jgi:hypothetical protein